MVDGFDRSEAADVWPCVAIVITAAIFIGVPIWGLVVPGPLRWAIHTDAFWQGGIEALVLAASVAAGLALNRRGWLLALVALPAALYLRRHAVDAALLVDGLQLEITIGLGMALRRALRLPRPRDTFDYVQAFIAGFALWSVCAWTLQALDAGSMRAMMWLAVVLAIPACCGGHRPLLLFLWQRVRARERTDRIWCGVLAAWLLVLFAHARTAIGFDSMWYGLRSPIVLVPGRSVYESLGLTSPVYYFPKIYEVFSLPLYVLKDYAALDGFSILLLLPLLLCCHRIMRELDTPRRAQLPLLALIATLPALANSTLSAKPDVLSTLFVVAAAWFGLSAVRRHSGPAFAWMLACIALACSAKITAIPYAGMVLLATAAACWRNPAPMPGADDASLSARHAGSVLALAAVAALFVTARTLLLAGVPTIGPGPLLRLWQALGFELKEPAGTLHWTRAQDWADVPALLWDWLFRPHVLGDIVTGWVGNVWAWLAAIAFVAALRGVGPIRLPARSRLPLSILMATGLALAVGNRYQVRGGDGNYFLFALLPAIVCAGTAAFRRVAGRPRLSATALACVSAFVAFQAAYSFASAAWTPGTSAFDLNFSIPPRATRRTRAAMLAPAGLSRIAAFLHGLPRSTRVSGIVETPAQFWLPVCFEGLQAVLYSRPEYVADARSIRHFLRERHIDYFIMLRDGVKTPPSVYISPSVADAARQLVSLPGVNRIDDDHYYLLDLRAVAPADLDPDTGRGNKR